jgi:alpha-L-fucosidase 2
LAKIKRDSILQKAVQDTSSFHHKVYQFSQWYKEKFAYDPGRGIHFRTKVLVSGKNTRAEGESIVVDGAREVTLYIVDATSFNGYDKDPVKEGKPYKALADARLKRLSGVSFEKLRVRHESD